MNTERDRRYRSEGTGGFDTKDFKSIGDNVVFEAGVLVFHPEKISIGRNVYVGHNTILKGYHKNELTIGDHTWIGQGCFIHSAGGIRIGKAVGIGPMVKIISSFHRSDDLSLPILYQDLVLKEVVIGDGSDIGIGVIILPGVTIGEGAMIGAGAVVTKSVPPHSVTAGVPARIIRNR